MSKRKNLERRRVKKLKRHAETIVSKLTAEQQDRLADIIAKKVTNVPSDHSISR